MTYAPTTKMRDILKEKRATINKAPLQPGSPGWDEIQTMTWGDSVKVEFFEDGEIEIERFVTTGVDSIAEDALARLIDEDQD